VAAALLQLTIVPYLRIGNAQLICNFVFAVTATTAGTVEAGLISHSSGLDDRPSRPAAARDDRLMLLVPVGIAAILGRTLEHSGSWCRCLRSS
jgi:hypothetical protein